ncbi:response regulator [bacterium]|nr:response regulator [bacterium]
MAKPIRTLVVSGDAPGRAAATLALRAVAGVELLAPVGDGAEALRRVARRSPDLVLVEFLLPGRSGLQIGAALKRRRLGPRVVLVSLGGGEAWDAAAREFGIDAVVRRQDLAAEMPRLLARLFPERRTHVHGPDPAEEDSRVVASRAPARESRELSRAEGR